MDLWCVLDVEWFVFVQYEQVGGVVDLGVDQYDVDDVCIVQVVFWLQGWVGVDLIEDVG